ncbi:hypothetical protein [Haloarchaeobius sp. DFWS5]|uniref:hypothetical protein n=1 Tax=Haloarchaeobius sp. DFWS5 TaxID=3446114 RepID=UPI003EBFA53B
MHVRDAVEADAEAMSAIVDAPTEMLRNLVHDRTVRVVEADQSGDADPNVDVGETETATLLGFVSFDAKADAVHVTQLAGTDEACERLLEEPMRFARTEGMAVEILVTDTEGPAAAAVEAAGFDRAGQGPRFEGRETIRYRYTG